MQVDLTRSEKLHLEFNITLPGLPCEALVMDTGDASGKWESDADMQRAKWVQQAAAVGCRVLDGCTRYGTRQRQPGIT